MQSTTKQDINLANNREAISTPASSATFASADLIANTPDAVSTSLVASTSTSPVQPTPKVNPSSAETVAGVMSPEDFPLNVSSEKKAWPRSPVNANSDPALEAYLVRHNQMMAQDGMGGFVPYVDVVAQDGGQPDKTIDAKTSENAGDTK